MLGNSSRAINAIAPILAIAGWLGMTLPSIALTTSSVNDFRVCAGRLRGLEISVEAVSQACATALRPRDLSACVTRIQRQTQFAATDALSSCRQARRPQELAACVVGISRNTPQEALTPAVLNYCGRSLLPLTFGQCVVGLRAEIDITPAQAMDTCIDARDRISSIPSGSTPPTTPPTSRPTTEFQRTFETVPTPANPGNK
jgi:hypothetical protein